MEETEAIVRTVLRNLIDDPALMALFVSNEARYFPQNMGDIKHLHATTLAVTCPSGNIGPRFHGTITS